LQLSIYDFEQNRSEIIVVLVIITAVHE